MVLRVFLIILATYIGAMTVFSQNPPIEAGVPHTLAVWRAARYSEVRYKLDLTLEKMSPVLKGTIEIRLKIGGAGGNNADPIILDWRKIRGKEDLSTVSNILLNGKPAMFQEKDEHIVISGAADGENTVRLDFTSPILTSGGAITRYVDRQDQGEYIYSLFVPSDASTAFPVFDQPDIKGRFTLRVMAPNDWNVVSNTPVSLSEPTEDYKEVARDRETVTLEKRWVRFFSFPETKPVSTYVFAFAAGDFTSVPEITAGALSRKSGTNPPPARTAAVRSTAPAAGPVSHIYVRRSQAAKFEQHAAEVFRLNREGVKFLEGYFDYEFPFPKYDLVLIPEFPFGGMEHAGATFLREEAIIFPQEPTANNYISRANLIFHEAAHQWFGDTVTMRWFDDLWLKEGFAEFMAYKTLEKVMPEYNAWKVFYERNKQAAYLTDSTKGTTPIYQEIPNLSAAKSAYGNIVYRKAPSFLKQAEFYIEPGKFQIAVRAFLKRHEYANAGWEDLVREFENVEIAELKKGEYYAKLTQGDKDELERFTRWSVNTEWAEFWVKKPGMAIYRVSPRLLDSTLPLESWINSAAHGAHTSMYDSIQLERSTGDESYNWLQDVRVLRVNEDGTREEATAKVGWRKYAALPDQEVQWIKDLKNRKEYKFSAEPSAEPLKVRRAAFIFPNYRDYGYGIFLLDEKSRTYALNNIQNEKDLFLRTMMWGSLWDSVREAELDPKDYVELVIKNLGGETDEVTIATLLGRVSTAMNYYLPEKQRDEIAPRLETLLIEKMITSETLGLRLTFYRSFLNVASTAGARKLLKEILKAGWEKPVVKDGITPAAPAAPGLYDLPQPKTKDKFDIVTRLIVLGDPEAQDLLTGLEKVETSDEARRYAYAARAGIASAENKAKYFEDFVNNKEVSESWIEAGFGTFNTVRHSDLTLPYLDRALAELPNLKRNRKIFFVNGWLGAFIGGQRSEQALETVNKFLAGNPNLDKDLRLKILENADGLERAVKIRKRFAPSR